VDLVAVSFGAAIASEFVDRHPDRAWSLTYVDPMFNTGRPLRPEERSAFAWDVHMVFRGGTDEMARSQLDDFFYPDRGAPFTESRALRAAMPRAAFVPVDSAGHLSYLDQPDTVAGAVARFLRAAAPSPLPR
jgi:pimeloyl-ACP methyl ester carboxylesterase